jgi:hypothetical protein
MLDALAIERNGKAVTATLELPSAEADAAFTGMMSALAIYGVRRYIAPAKTAEARSTVAAMVVGRRIGTVPKLGEGDGHVVESTHDVEIAQRAVLERFSSAVTF